MTRRAWRIALSTIAIGPLLMWLVACSTTVSTSSGPVGNEAPSARAGGTEEGDPDRRAAVRLELASAYFSRGQFDVALGEVKLALAANPNLGAAYNLRGLIYGNLGETALAEESFRRALQINASDTDAMQNYGWYLCGQQRYTEAQAQFSQALSVPRNRQVPRTLLTQGVCQARAGLLPEAEISLQRSLDLDPGNPSTVTNLAEVLYRRSDYERARFYIRRVNSQPSLMNAQTLWLAARIEKRLNNQNGVQDLGNQLLNRFRESREARAYEKGQFNE